MNRLGAARTWGAVCLVVMLGACKKEEPFEQSAADRATRSDVQRDAVPESFGFPSQTGVERATEVVSDAATIRGIDAAVPVTVVDGEYSIGCDDRFTDAAGTITNGETICVRHRSADTFATTVTTTLTVGSVSASFSSTTEEAPPGTGPGPRPSEDASPDSFTFAPARHVAPVTMQASNTASITGINVPVPISVLNGEYSIGCTDDFTSATGTVTNNQTVCVRHISGSGSRTTVLTRLVVGDGQSIFSSTTATQFVLPYYTGDGKIHGYYAHSGTASLIDTDVPNDAIGGFAYQPHILTAADLDPVTSHVNELVPQLLVYVKNGKLYRASLAAEHSGQPVQVSSYTDICGIAKLLHDFADPANSWIVLRRSGANADCANYDQRPTVVRASAAATQGGVIFDYNDGYNTGFLAVHDALGRIASVLVTEGIVSATLRRYDANLSSHTDLMPLTGGQFFATRELWTRSAYLDVRAAVTNQSILVRYDEQTRSAVTVFEFPRSVTSEIALDSTNVYVADNNKLMRIPHSASGIGAESVVTTLPNASGSVLINSIYLTADGHAALNTFDGSNSGEDGAYVVLANANNGVATKIFGHGGGFTAVAGNLLYGGTNDFAGNTTTATLNSDGSNLVSRPSSYWARSSLPWEFDASPEGITPYPGSQAPSLPGFMLRVDVGTGSQSIQAINPADGSVHHRLGTIADTRSSVQGFGFGSSGLLDVYGNDSSGRFVQDVYGVNFDVADSLATLQNSAEIDQHLE